MTMYVITVGTLLRCSNFVLKAFTAFSVLFEVVSAYGNIGLSLGYPTANASFSGQFRPVSKLIIIAMQIRGRHRGLPYDLDRAVSKNVIIQLAFLLAREILIHFLFDPRQILLPSESLNEKEAQDARDRMLRRNSNLSVMSVAGVQGLARPPSFTSTTTSPHQTNGPSIREEKESRVD